MLHSPAAHSPAGPRSWAVARHRQLGVPHRQRHRHLPGRSQQAAAHSHSWEVHSLAVRHRQVGNRMGQMADSQRAADSLEGVHHTHKRSRRAGDNLEDRQQRLGLPWPSGKDPNQMFKEHLCGGCR